MAGTSGKPLSQKLGLKPGFRIFVDGAPADYRELVGEWPDGAKLVAQAKAPLDMVHLFATQAKGLATKLSRYRDAIAPGGMIWVSWPKKPHAYRPISATSRCATSRCRSALSTSRFAPSTRPGPV